MIHLVYAVYVICLFLIAVSLTFSFFALLRTRFELIFMSVPFLLIVGVPAYFANGYILAHVDSPHSLLDSIPLGLGSACGFIAGFGMD